MGGPLSKYGQYMDIWATESAGAARAVVFFSDFAVENAGKSSLKEGWDPRDPRLGSSPQEAWRAQIALQFAL
jgi:hypothetical protein